MRPHNLAIREPHITFVSPTAVVRSGRGALGEFQDAIKFYKIHRSKLGLGNSRSNTALLGNQIGPTRYGDRTLIQVLLHLIHGARPGDVIRSRRLEGCRARMGDAVIWILLEPPCVSQCWRTVFTRYMGWCTLAIWNRSQQIPFVAEASKNDFFLMFFSRRLFMRFLFSQKF